MAGSQKIPITSPQAVRLADVLVYGGKYDYDKSYWENIKDALNDIRDLDEYV